VIVSPEARPAAPPGSGIKPAAPVAAEDAAGHDAITAEIAAPGSGASQPGAPPPHARALRSTSRIETEITGLQQLLAVTPRSAPDRPQVLYRLAIAYADLASAAAAEGRAAASQGAHGKAVELFTTLHDDYPAFARLDEVLFERGNQQLAVGARDRTRRDWFELIQKFPQSKLIPNAYLGFGELFFEESAADPSKLQLAKQAYMEVLKYPPPANTAWGYAQYKLGWVHYNLGSLEAALAAFAKTVEFGNKYASLAGAPALAREGAKDAVRVYARVGRPEAAWDFLRHISGDQGSSDARTVALIGRLGEAYLSDGRSKEALELWENVAASHASPASCRAAAQALQQLHRDATVPPTGVSRLEGALRAGCATGP